MVTAREEGVIGKNAAGMLRAVVETKLREFDSPRSDDPKE
jgi:hypothetical protein